MSLFPKVEPVITTHKLCQFVHKPHSHMSDNLSSDNYAYLYSPLGKLGIFARIIISNSTIALGPISMSVL